MEKIELHFCLRLSGGKKDDVRREIFKTGVAVAQERNSHALRGSDYIISYMEYNRMDSICPYHNFLMMLCGLSRNAFPNVFSREIINFKGNKNSATDFNSTRGEVKCMFTALTSDKQRISVECAATGESYFCPVCGNSVMVKAAASENVRKHFAHKRNCLCVDNWKHDMSDWHFDWQSMFPIENREVVVENGGVYHRADVLINNTVIEFQHSPIQCSEFEERNYFYKNCGCRVIWLFDVTDKMKTDECFGLVWKRKNPLFTCMKTRIDGLFVQHYLPDTEDLLLISHLDPKVVDSFRTFSPIMPENFLKEFGAIQDDNVLSIQDIFDKTKELDRYLQQKQREEEERQRRRNANEVTPKSMLTAGTPKSLGQMGLARTRPSNKGKVFVSIEGRQRGEATELVNILSGDSAEIKVVKGLGDLQWEVAGAEQEIHCGTLPLFQEIVKYLCHGEGFSIGHVVLLYTEMTALLFAYIVDSYT